MPRHRHVESHFSGSEIVRDIVLGMSDGLTVPFALAAGLSGAVADARVILVAGAAELAAGAIAMGLGGYMAAKSEADTWASEVEREGREVEEIPDVEQEEVRKVFREWGISGDALESATGAICADKDRWVRFMMKEELGLSEPHPARARLSALTIGGSYVAGGAIPLAPYLFAITVPEALLASVAVTMAALGLFGGVKGKLTGRPPLREAAKTMLVGAMASGAAYGIARLISG
jgi:VIT1/CCC1 family predicted Fe2+/Mn2+ transporter